eukprot:Clim_evm2s222 gene=Clim_evmTU2s222
MSRTTVSQRKFAGSSFRSEQLKEQLNRSTRSQGPAYKAMLLLLDLFAIVSTFVATAYASSVQYLRTTRKSALDYVFKENRDYASWRPKSKMFRDTYDFMSTKHLMPVVAGIENIPQDRPVLFVVNHATGALDLSQTNCVIRRCAPNRPIRAIADHMHWRIPIWNRMVEQAGAFRGTRENCQAVMSLGHNVLVYPEGGDGVFRSAKLPKYTGFFKKRAGFVRMAAKNNYDIVPVSVVGAEEQYDALFDIPIGRLLGVLDGHGKRKDFVFPVPNPLSVFLPHRLYVSFHEAIHTEDLPGEDTPEDQIWEVREQTRMAIEEGIKRDRVRLANNEGHAIFWPTEIDEMTAKVLAAQAEEQKSATPSSIGGL